MNNKKIKSLSKLADELEILTLKLSDLRENLISHETWVVAQRKQNEKIKN